jgi:hypothetical protein
MKADLEALSWFLLKSYPTNIKVISKRTNANFG